MSERQRKMSNYRKNKKTRDPACLSRALLPRSRSAQVGETVTWIIATLIIIGILILFIFISSLMSKIKAIRVGNLETDIKITNLLTEKTSFAYQLTNYKNKEIIEGILEEND